MRPGALDPVDSYFEAVPGAFSLESASWLVSAGGLVLLAKNVGVTGELFYSHANHEFDDPNGASNNSSEEFGTQFGVSVYLF